MVHTLAGAAGAWFIQTVLTNYETQHKSGRDSSSAQRYDGTSAMISVYHITNIFYNLNIVVVRILSIWVSQTQTTPLTRYAFVSNPVLLLDNP